MRVRSLITGYLLRSSAPARDPSSCRLDQWAGWKASTTVFERYGRACGRLTQPTTTDAPTA